MVEGDINTIAENADFTKSPVSTLGYFICSQYSESGYTVGNPIVTNSITSIDPITKQEVITTFVQDINMLGAYYPYIIISAKISLYMI